jgi:hypothetical protein
VNWKVYLPTDECELRIEKTRRSSTINEAEKRKDQIRSDMFRLKNEGKNEEKTLYFHVEK